MVLLERILQEEYTFVNILYDATVLFYTYLRECVCEVFTKMVSSFVLTLSLFQMVLWLQGLILSNPKLVLQIAKSFAICHL